MLGQVRRVGERGAARRASWTPTPTTTVPTYCLPWSRPALQGPGICRLAGLSALLGPPLGQLCNWALLTTWPSLFGMRARASGWVTPRAKHRWRCLAQTSRRRCLPCPCARAPRGGPAHTERCGPAFNTSIEDKARCIADTTVLEAMRLASRASNKLGSRATATRARRVCAALLPSLFRRGSVRGRLCSCNGPRDQFLLRGSRSCSGPRGRALLRGGGDRLRSGPHVRVRLRGGCHASWARGPRGPRGGVGRFFLGRRSVWCPLTPYDGGVRTCRIRIVCAACMPSLNCARMFYWPRIVWDSFGFTRGASRNGSDVDVAVDCVVESDYGFA